MMYDIDTFALEDDVITALGDKIDSYRIEKILRSDL